MVVTRSSFESVLGELLSKNSLAIDTETTGLRPYHGDRLFSLIVAASIDRIFYFNFNVTEEFSEEETLPRSYLKMLRPLFSRVDITWVGSNLKYDIHILWQEGVELGGKLHCTQVTHRLIEDDRFQYGLDALAKDLLGESKDDAVKEYCNANGLWSKVQIPGKDKEDKRYHYEKVPRNIIVPYAEKDVYLSFKVFNKQIEMLTDIDEKMRSRHPNLPTVLNVYRNECALLRVVFEMERDGVKIDQDYSKIAADFYSVRMKDAADEFEKITGFKFRASNKLFQEVFASEKSKWVMTKEKKSKVPRKKPFVPQPCFDSDVLSTFENPAAKCILEYRDSKSRSDFFNGFLYHADSLGIIHASFDQAGCRTSRFSCNNPNMQQLTADENISEDEMPVRKAVIQRSKDYTIFSIDFKQVEYRALVHMARDEDWARAIMSGMDVHQFVADKLNISRKLSKGVNFGLVFGCGPAKLGVILGIPEEEARGIRQRYFEELPKIKVFLKRVVEVAEQRGYIINPFGRRATFRKYIDPVTGKLQSFAYAAPNTLIQGGMGDVMKFAMVRINKLLKGMKSKVIASIHDELILDVHKDEEHIVSDVKNIMETTFKSDLLVLEVSIEKGINLYDLAKC